MEVAILIAVAVDVVPADVRAAVVVQDYRPPLDADSGVMRTNNSQLAMNTKRAPNGEIRFTVIMEVRWKPFFQRFYRVRSTHFDTSRNTSVAPSEPP